MSRFQDVLKGTAAINPVTFPLVNVTGWKTTPTSEQVTARDADVARVKAASPGQAPVEVPTHATAGARVLSPGMLETVLEKALAKAKAAGADEKSELYNLELQLYTCAFGYVDLSSNPESPVLYFGDTVDQCVDNLKSSPHISRDTLVYLCEQLEAWGDQCNPCGNGKHTEAEMWAAIEGIVGDPSSPLFWRPSERLICMHTMASMLLGLLQAKSSPSSSSSENSTNESKPNASSRKKPQRSPRASKRRIPR